MKLRDLIHEDIDRKARITIGHMAEMIMVLDDKVSELQEFLSAQSDEWHERFSNGDTLEEFIGLVEGLKDDLENAKDNFEDSWDQLDINVEDPEP